MNAHISGGSVELVELNSWMKSLPDETKLSEMSLPGTHDSGAITFDSCAGPFAQTQTLSIQEQLSVGIRVLDVRCHHFNNSFKIHHKNAYANLGFEEVLDTAETFLKENPSEVVIMRIKEEYGEMDQETNNRHFEETFQTFIDARQDFFWCSNILPELGEVRGKIVVLDNTPAAPRFGLSWHTLKMQDEWEIPGHYDIDKAMNWKWQLIKQFFEETNAGDEDEVFINFLTAFRIPDLTPANVANGVKDTDKNYPVDGMNTRTIQHLHPGIKRTGWVYMDFPSVPLIQTIIDRNFLLNKI